MEDKNFEELVTRVHALGRAMLNSSNKLTVDRSMPMLHDNKAEIMIGNQSIAFLHILTARIKEDHRHDDLMNKYNGKLTDLIIR